MDYPKMEFRAEYDEDIRKARQKAELVPWWRILSDAELEELLLRISGIAGTQHYYPEIAEQSLKDNQYARIYEEYVRRQVGDKAISRIQWGLWTMWFLGWLAGKEFQENAKRPY